MMERLQGNLVRPSYQPVEYRPYISTTELNEMSNSPSTTQESQVQFINSGPQPPGPGPYWRTGVLRRFPWTGIGSLVVALVAMLAAVVVLIRSDGQALDSWRVQPSVILSIASALFRTALVYALAQGAIVFWWNRAIRGSTIKDLHQIFGQASSFKDAALSGRHVNMVAISTVIVTLCVAIGPLLQKATSVTTLTTTLPVKLSGHIASGLPQGYTALLVAGEADLGGVSLEFSQVLRSIDQNKDIEYKDSGISGCEGNCSSVIQGAGIVSNCSTEVTDWALSPQEGTPIFQVDSAWRNDGSRALDGGYSLEAITLTVSMAGDITSQAYNKQQNCTGKVTTITCDLSEAVVEYNVTISSGIVAINSSSELKKVGDAPKYGWATLGTTSTIGGLSLYLNERYSANVSLLQTHIGGYSPPSNFPSDTTMANYTVQAFNSFSSQYLTSDAITTDRCNYTWNDPTQDIFTYLNNIMFRTALQAGKQNPDGIVLPDEKGINTITHPTAQQMDAIQKQSQIVYQTHFLYLVIAVAIMGSGILSVLTSFFGWWRLGRGLSLSPIEIANAFDAPALAEEHANFYKDVDVLVKEIGNRRVMYGEAMDAYGGTRLIFSEPEKLRRL